jgi:hypothetical protein
MTRAQQARQKWNWALSFAATKSLSMSREDEKTNIGTPIRDEPAEVMVADAMAVDDLVSEAVDDDCVKPTREEPVLVLYTDALPAVEDDNEKRGHSCCGCCCDTRRAVVIVDVIYLHLTLLSLFAGGSESSSSDGPSAGAIVFLSLLMIVATILGIVGALRYNIYMVGLAILPFFIEFIAYLGYGPYWLVPIVALCVYPHVMFIKEVHEGIMTKERYTHEQQSCCCV